MRNVDAKGEVVTDVSQMSSDLGTAKEQATARKSALNREFGELIKTGTSPAATAIREAINKLRGTTVKRHPITANLKQPPKWAHPGPNPHVGGVGGGVVATGSGEAIQ